jgi:hypothetical protein
MDASEVVSSAKPATGCANLRHVEDGELALAGRGPRTGNHQL